jgi:TonB family protein
MSLLESMVSAEWVLNAAVQTLLILGIGAFLLYVSRNKGAPLRSWISLITMLALILLPLISVSLNQLDYLPLQTVLPLSFDKAPSASVSVEYSLAELPSDNAQNKRANYFEQFWTGTVILKIINLFGMIWGIGLLFMLFRFGMGAISIRSLKRGMAPVCDPRITAALKSAQDKFPKQHRIQVFTSPKAPYPMAVGIIKPFILIPERLLHKWNDNQIQGILLHELSHIHHHDLIIGILQRFVTALNWWNPLAYALSTSYSRAREEISDNHVLLQNDSKEYAECLIYLAERATLWKRLSVSVGLASPHIPLKDRVKHILSKERIMETNLKKSTVMVMVVTAFLLVATIAGSRLMFATTKPATTIEKVDVALPNVQEQDKKDQDKETDADVGKDVKPPKLIKKVEPVYPDEAKKAGIEGTVTVEATTDDKGRVQKVKVLKSIPELDQAAVDAVKQWVYEPMVIDGKPHGVVFTIACRFSLEDKNKGESFEGGVTGTDEKPAVRAIGDIKPPKLIKIVKPIYPDEAKKAEAEGVVIVEATTDIYGRVVDTKILRSIPALDQAAIDAVKQWIYEPMIIDGEPRGVIFTVTCTFKLDDKQDDKGDAPVHAKGDIKPPKPIKKVAPVYPESARDAKIEGIVIIEATTDQYGKVIKTKILRSIPELDQAAIDAVKQWVYEPYIKDGKPVGVIFTVTVQFKLD